MMVIMVVVVVVMVAVMVAVMVVVVVVVVMVVFVCVPRLREESCAECYHGGRWPWGSFAAHPSLSPPIMTAWKSVQPSLFSRSFSACKRDFT
jgi:hypothetical protein